MLQLQHLRSLLALLAFGPGPGRRLVGHAWTEHVADSPVGSGQGKESFRQPPVFRAYINISGFINPDCVPDYLKDHKITNTF